MEGIRFFDCSCSVGIRNIVEPGSFYSTGDLIKKMKHYGIGKALVYHSMGRENDPQTGNGMLTEEIKGHPELEPVWVVMHHHTDEFPVPAKAAEQIKKAGVRAVRMFPSDRDQGYSMSEWNCGELFGMLEEYRIPLFIGLDQISWDGIHSLCCVHPKLPVILTDVGYRCNRNLYASFERFENLYIETYGYKVHRGIEEICGRFGAHRLVFGSGMPVYSGGAAVTMISYAEISPEEKLMIAGGNLEKLLGGVQL